MKRSLVAGLLLIIIMDLLILPSTAFPSAAGASPSETGTSSTIWAPAGDTPHHLYGIWGSSSSNVFAVGQAGTVLHYDGSTWSTMTSNTITRVLQ